VHYKRPDWTAGKVALGDRAMKLTVRITRKIDGFYRAVCPALPGCVVFAETRADAESKISQAVEGYLASLDVALPRELDRRLDQVIHASVA